MKHLPTLAMLHGFVKLPEDLATHAHNLEIAYTDALEEIARLRRPEEAESKRLLWLEDHVTLHTRVDILYVVDGYEVQVMHEDGITELSPRFHGATLAEAIDKASSPPQDSAAK